MLLSVSRGHSARYRVAARILVAGFGIAVALVAGATPSFAHAILESTSPAANATLTSSPREVTLTFGSPVALTDQLPALWDSSGKAIKIGASKLEAHKTTIAFPVPKLADGTYTVTWRAESTDGHVVHGAFAFNVGSRSATNAMDQHMMNRGGTSRAVGVLTGILRAIAFASFIGAVGSLVFVAISAPHLAGHSRAQLLTGAALFALGVAAIAECFALHPFTSGGSFGDIASFSHFRSSLHTTHGKALVTRFLLALVGIIAFSRHRLRGRRVLGLSLVGLWILAVTATFSLNGHPRSGRWQTLSVGLDFAHLIAAAAWVGGLFALVVLVLSDHESTEHRSVARRFSNIAATSVVVVVATGSVQAFRQLSHISDLWSQTYGRLLSVKVIVVGIILLVAARSRWLTKGEDVDHRKLRTMVAVETLGAAIVISITALLVNSPPPHDLIGAPAHTPPAAVAGPATATVSANGFTFKIQLDPAAVGPSQLMLEVTKAAGGPAKLFEVDATMQLASAQIDPITINFTDSGGMYMSKALILPLRGRWTVNLRVLTSPVDSFSTSTTITVV